MAEKKFSNVYTAKLTFLSYDNFWENQTPLQRNGMAAITKNTALPALTLALMAEHSSGVVV